jgi:hypothetical protein
MIILMSQLPLILQDEFWSFHLAIVYVLVSHQIQQPEQVPFWEWYESLCQHLIL